MSELGDRALLYRFEGRLADIAPIGPVPGGVRIDVPFTGSIVAGALAGGEAFGTDYLLQRDDGVGVIDARDTFAIPGGFLHATATGFVVPPDGVEMPSGAELLAADFMPPDIRLRIDAVAVCQTGVPAYEQLNRVLVKVDGWVNNATRELVLEGRPLGAGVVRTLPAASLAAAG